MVNIQVSKPVNLEANICWRRRQGRGDIICQEQSYIVYMNCILDDPIEYGLLFWFYQRTKKGSKEVGIDPVRLSVARIWTQDRLTTKSGLFCPLHYTASTVAIQLTKSWLTFNWLTLINEMYHRLLFVPRNLSTCPFTPQALALDGECPAFNSWFLHTLDSLSLSDPVRKPGIMSLPCKDTQCMSEHLGPFTSLRVPVSSWYFHAMLAGGGCYEPAWMRERGGVRSGISALAPVLSLTNAKYLIHV